MLRKKPHFSSFSDLHSHMKNTHKHVALALIWRGAEFQSRWCLHVSTVKGATGLQQTSVVVMVVGCVGGREMRLVLGWGRERGSRAPAFDCSGGTPPPEWKLCGKAGDHVIHSIFCSLPLCSAPFSSPACLLLLLSGGSWRIYDTDRQFLLIISCHMFKVVRCVCSAVLLRCIALQITLVFMSSNDVQGLRFLSVIYLNHMFASIIFVCVCLCLCVCRCVLCTCTCSCSFMLRGSPAC